MGLNISVSNGTGAGTKPPWSGGHGPKCVCTRCEKEKA